MRHHDKIRKFGRTRSQRKALLKSLAISLIQRERIKTTEAKAKELRPFVEGLITRGRKGDLTAIRLIAARLDNNKVIAQKIINDLSPRYKTRRGGYTRIIKLPARVGDGSSMAIIEFV